VPFLMVLPGDVRSGWITWEVPETSVPASMQWKLNFGGSGAEWDLTQPGQTPPAGPPVIAPSTAFNAPVTLHGDDGVAIQVIAMQLVDNAVSDFPSGTPDTRVVAVQFTFTNAGGAAHTEFPDFAVALIDADGEQFSSSAFGTDAGPGFDGTVDLKPGDSRVGFLAFEMPNDALPVKVQVRLDAGQAAEFGELGLT
jgi:hypothetical protein